MKVLSLELIVERYSSNLCHYKGIPSQATKSWVVCIRWEGEPISRSLKVWIADILNFCQTRT